MHLGVTAEQCIENTGWKLRIAKNVFTTEAVTDREISALRELQSA
jgi:glutaconate CoA-transferase subunit B